VIQEDQFTLIKIRCRSLRRWTHGENNSFSSYTHVSSITDPTNPASLLDYAEVNFYLADAAERSISGTPVSAAGFTIKVTASFEQWGATGVAATYLILQSSLCYSTRNMESKIGNQLC
jgi:hypothetical protein